MKNFLSVASDRIYWFSLYASRIKRFILFLLTAVLWCFFGTVISNWFARIWLSVSSRYRILKGYIKNEEPLSKSSLISFLLLNRADFLNVNLDAGFSFNSLNKYQPARNHCKVRLFLMLSFVRHRKLLSSFCSSIGYYSSSTHAFHPGTESVFVSSLSVRRLKCSLHCSNSSLNRGAKIVSLW